MAAPNLLHFATTTNSNLNFQIPTINIKLDRSNFILWRTTIISALETFDLQEHVLNPNPPPTTIDVPAVEAVPATDTTPAVAAVPATTAVNPDYTTWKKRDRFVLLWLKSTLSDHALAMVALATSSRLAWITLETSFQAQTRASRMQLKTQLQTLTKGSMSMIEYLEKKRSISDSLAATLHPIPDEDLISYILNGLDVSYGPFITGLHDEILNRRTNRRANLQLISKATPTLNQRGNQVDFPSRKPNPRNNQRQAHLAHQPNPSTTIDPAWYFDTGATDHVTPDITKLNIAEPYNGDDKLQVGNGNHLNISHVGSSVLPNLKLPNVLLVPDLTKSLLSVPKLTEDNNVSMEFFPKTCSVKTLQGQTILRGDKHHSLYRLPPHSFRQSPRAFHSSRISLHG
ncbi:retrovirus-related pol polyprotein from transposon TNT 1-94, partial [Tanacetum coccineum]